VYKRVSVFVAPDSDELTAAGGRQWHIYGAKM